MPYFFIFKGEGDPEPETMSEAMDNCNLNLELLSKGLYSYECKYWYKNKFPETEAYWYEYKFQNSITNWNYLITHFLSACLNA